ncbi:MAG TPA: hypothetical protein VGO03_08205 [Acidimicrobiia bacterium]|jgi:hypothetical protein
MTSQRRIRARNAGLNKVRRVTMRVAGGGLVLSGGIAALASATYAGTHHKIATYARAGAVTRSVPTSNRVAPLTDPTLPPTTLAPANTTATSATRSPTPTSAAPATTPPLQAPATTPQTQPVHTPPVVVTGGT